jgi:hypothetical protein
MKVETGWPSEIYRKLYSKVYDLANRPNVEEFYIGRSVEPHQNASRHGYDDIKPIYYTDSIDNAKEIESDLIEAFENHSKCNNEASDGRGNYASGYGQYVYVALWYR